MHVHILALAKLHSHYCVMNYCVKRSKGNLISCLTLLDFYIDLRRVLAGLILKKN